MDRGDSSRLAFTAFPEYFFLAFVPPLINKRSLFFPTRLTNPLQISLLLSSLGRCNRKRTNDRVWERKKERSLWKEKTRGTTPFRIAFRRPFFPSFLFLSRRFDLSTRIGRKLFLPRSSQYQRYLKGEKEEEEEERRESKLTAAKTLLFRSIASRES